MSMEPGTDNKQPRSAYADGPCLFADIGATHARLALETAPGVLRHAAVLLCNRDWQFSSDEVRRALGLSTLLIVNDFTALAMAVPGMKSEDLLQVGGGKPAPHSVSGVLGPGTGLGAC